MCHKLNKIPTTIQLWFCIQIMEMSLFEWTLMKKSSAAMGEVTKNTRETWFYVMAFVTVSIFIFLFIMSMQYPLCVELFFFCLHIQLK